jgi:anti-sigma factor RsiW
MSCDEIQELLSDLIDDELQEGARAGVEAHLSSCDDCARFYRQLKRTVRFVRANARADLRPGTPGGAYALFTRAMVDPAFGRPPDDVRRGTGWLTLEEQANRHQ